MLQKLLAMYGATGLRINAQGEVYAEVSGQFVPVKPEHVITQTGEDFFVLQEPEVLDPAAGPNG